MATQRPLTNFEFHARMRRLETAFSQSVSRALLSRLDDRGAVAPTEDDWNGAISDAYREYRAKQDWTPTMDSGTVADALKDIDAGRVRTAQEIVDELRDQHSICH